MAFVNLPANLQDLFYSITDRVAKLETGPNSAQTTADSAQTTANSAQTDATTAISNANAALAQANIAYALAGTSLQKDANTITNSSNNMTAINANGITVYSGASMSSGARVIMNSAGIAGYNSSGTATFAINASTGAASFSGNITGSAITGSTLNISGNCIIDSSGFLTATGATITGTITATSGSFTGSLYYSTGTIAGWTISSTQIYSGTGAFMRSDNGNIGGNSITAFSDIQSYGQIVTTGGSGGYIEASGYIRANGSLYAAGATTTTSTANCYINASSGLIARSTSSQRYKVVIEEQIIPKEAILALTPKSYVDKAEAEAKGTTEGLPRLLGVIAEDLANIPVVKDLLVQYNSDGQPDAVNYDRIAVALIPLLKEHEARLTKLEAK
jgi:hypothetical protein